MNNITPYKIFYLIVLTILSIVSKGMAQKADSVTAVNDTDHKYKLEWYTGVPPRRVQLPNQIKESNYTSPQEFKTELLTYFNNNGYLNSRIDSIRVSSIGDKKAGIWRVYGNKGCKYRIDTVTIHQNPKNKKGDSLKIIEEYESFLDNDVSFSKVAVANEFKRISAYLDEKGFLMHELSVDRLVTNDSLCTVSIHFNVEKGRRIVSSGILVPPLEYTNTDYVRKISSLSDSTVITPKVLRSVRNRLQRTRIFGEVNRPEVVQRGDSFMVALNLEELNPNKLDLLMGYQPDQQGGNKVVGDGEILLRNVVTNGSLVRLQFERLEQLTTRLNLELEQHWIGYVPVTAGLEFRFFQQDSSYQVRRFRVNGKYWLNSTTAITGRITRGGSSVNQNEELQIPVLESNSLSGGLGLEYQNIDNRFNPTHGIDGRLFFDTGFKNISDGRPLAKDIDQRLNQKSFELKTRGYIQLFRRHVLSPSVHGYFLNSRQVGEDDLNKFGGARSLRGYREDQFLARRMYWGDVEYRYLLDRSSHAFLFGAGGWYSRPELTLTVTDSGDGSTGSSRKAQESWLYSYGLGFTYRTSIGMFQFSYAISSEDPISNGKVHFGIVADI